MGMSPLLEHINPPYLIAHEVANEALVEALHFGVGKEVEGVMVLQQAMRAARGEIQQLERGFVFNSRRP